MMHWLKFNAVGAMGMTVQITLLAAGVHLLELHYILATLLSVEAALLHNFVWHVTWTWPEPHRPAPASARFPAALSIDHGNDLHRRQYRIHVDSSWNGTVGTGSRQSAGYRGLFTCELCRVQPFRLCFARGFQCTDATRKHANRS